METTVRIGAKAWRLRGQPLSRRAAVGNKRPLRAKLGLAALAATATFSVLSGPEASATPHPFPASDGWVCAVLSCRLHGPTASESFGQRLPNARQSALSSVSPSYWLAGATGAVYAFGDAGHFGSVGAGHLSGRVVGIAATPDAKGYWLAGANGAVYAFGDAGHFGSVGAGHLSGRVVGIAATPDAKGYWLAGANGAVYAFGDARYFGSVGAKHLTRPVAGIAASPDAKGLAQPVVGMAATPDGRGYWLVSGDGRISSFGDARSQGSTPGSHLSQPIVGMATAATGGYWLVSAGGRVLPFHAPYYGSARGARLAQPVVGMAATPDGRGYWLVSGDGRISSFGDARSHGSTAGSHLSQPIVGMATPSSPSLTIKVSDLLVGKVPAVQVRRPDGSQFALARATTIDPAEVGTWTVDASRVGATHVTYYPTVSTTTVVVSGGGQASVTVDYADVVADTTRVAQNGAIKSVGPPASNGGQTVVVSDPDHTIAVGDTLVSGTTPVVPDGLLLSVLSVTANGNGTDTVVGRPAQLSDAVPAGSFNVTSGPSGTTSSGRVASTLRAADMPLPELTCDSGHLGLDGGVNFTPTLNISAQWGGIFHPTSVSAFNFTVSGTMAASLSATFGFTGSCTASVSIDGPELATISFWVGPVPVVIVPKLDFEAGLTVSGKAGYTVSVSQDVTLTFGLAYSSDTGLTPVHRVSHTSRSAGFEPTVDGDAELSVGPKLSFLVYGLAGPYLSAGPFLAFHVYLTSNPWWTLTGGAQAGAGIEFPLFHFDKSDDHILQVSWPIARSTTSSPGEPLVITTGYLPPAAQGQAFGTQLSAIGGTPPTPGLSPPASYRTGSPSTRTPARSPAPPPAPAPARPSP